LINEIITIYVRNSKITPSSYYRIIQYTKDFKSKPLIRSAIPDNLYKFYLNISKSKSKAYFLVGTLYYLVMIIRITVFLLLDLIRNPDYIILSKSFCPRYTPIFLRFLIDRVTKKTIFIWDFDDYIFESGEISKRQADILMKNSYKIIVTNEFLKSKIESVYRNKVVLLPTTDGDLQGFSQNELEEKRKRTYATEIRLVWVATSGNIPHLLGIISALDEAAEYLSKNLKKQLVLISVCDKPLNYDTKHLKLINMKWTRELAKNQIYDSHIGIMPLNNNSYSLGKGGFKLIQYISACLPIIGSNVGYNSHVIKKGTGYLIDDEFDKRGWIEAVIKLSESYSDWLNYSRESYDNWNRNFSYDKNLEFWNELLTTKRKKQEKNGD